MKVDIAFLMQKAEQWSGEVVMNAIQMHASWKETDGADQASWGRVESVSNLQT
jgi:hypothetical protein